MRKLLATMIFSAVAALCASQAQAIAIDIDPVAYGGTWQISGVTSLVSGPATVDVAAGTYEMRVAGFGLFDFDVAANGSVTSLNSAAALGSLNLLTFNTAEIQVDPAGYAGSWWLFGVVSTTGYQAATVVPGLSYQMRVASTGIFSFYVAANGDVTSQNPAAATGSGSVLTFSTVVVQIDPAAYTGNWWLFGVVSTSGLESATVVPGLTYQMRVASTGIFLFDVAANGDVSSQNSAAASGSGSVLTFNTTGIEIDPAAYTGSWWLFGIVNTTGLQSATVVPGLTYQMRVASFGIFTFEVAANGDVTSQNAGSANGSGNVLTFNTTVLDVDPGAFSGTWWLFGVLNTSGYQSAVVVPALSYQIRVGATSIGAFNVNVAANGDVSSLNASAASGSGSLLTFQTTGIQVDPGSYAGTWYVLGVVGGQAGSQNLVVVPGVSYQLRAGSDAANFSVAEPCAVNPPQITLDGAGFEISCGAEDSDGDGVPDTTDNCPQDANPGQVDQDMDGEGDACDADLDGDGVANDIDNCPDLENPGQEDFDGDLVGDACDEDADGDSVPDAVDNCLLEPNTDQADNDGDLIGDACDPDDDNDSIDDAFDNCPFDSNVDQSDADGNGEGDVCDGDVDGDGVANDGDLCPLSPLNLLTNADGCTGAQFIALTCVEENFGQHGKYVSCVAHAAQDAVEEGLIRNQEKSRFVKQAARSRE